MRPRIGILTTFTGSDQAYSLVNVVRSQLQMLFDGLYDPVLFVAPSFHGDGVFAEHNTDIRRVAKPDAKQKEVRTVLWPLVDDIDVMFCHDILFLGQHKTWAAAIRHIAKNKPHIAWLHWQHSRGGHSPIEHMDRSWFCYPNQGDLEHVAQINSTTENRVRYIPHPLDIDYLGWPSLAIRIAEDFDFPFVDVAALLPTRLDRQKQVEKAVRIFAGLKKAGRTVCYLIADAQATGKRFKTYKEDILKIAEDQGLNEQEIVFLGEKYEECQYGTPRPTIKALLEMSNLFIQPSNAETSSLVVMEAALAGNLVIINADFPPIHHLYKDALAFPFGSIFEDTKYYRHIKVAGGGERKVEDSQSFWDDTARRDIIPVLDGQLTLQVKRQQLRDRWPSRVFREHLEPLVLEVYQAVSE